MSWIIWLILGLIFVVAIILIVKKIKNKDEDIFSQASGVSSKFSDCCKKIGKFFGGGA